MTYREDPDLDILSQCSNEELDILVNLLQYEAKSTEGLSSDPSYIQYNPDHKKYWRKIAEEIQLFGGNTLMNAMRGGGIFYKEICQDVANKLQIVHTPKDTTLHLEARIVLRLFEEAIHGMSEEERYACIESLTIPHETSSQGIALGITALQGNIDNGILPPYQIFNVIANAIGRQLLGQGIIFMGSIALTRVIGAIANPIGWFLAGTWALIDIAGPAYRITIPAVVFIASFRQRIYMQLSQV